VAGSDDLVMHMTQYIAMLFALISGLATAQVPAVLLEACSALEPASKRLECLRAANENAQPSSVGTAPQPAYRPPVQSPAANSYNFAPAPSTHYSAPSGKTCYTGPRGGTYTVTKSGKKNYGGC
jgi:hypothetical protein